MTSVNSRNPEYATHPDGRVWCAVPTQYRLDPRSRYMQYRWAIYQWVSATDSNTTSGDWQFVMLTPRWGRHRGYSDSPHYRHTARLAGTGYGPGTAKYKKSSK